MRNWYNVMIAGQQIQLVKLIGAFVMFGAILMFFYAAAEMFEDWDGIKTINNCLLVAKGDEAFFNTCKAMANDAFNIFLKPGQAALNGKQIYLILVKPIADLFIWIAILLFGIALYYAPTRVLLPVKEKTSKAKK